MATTNSASKGGLEGVSVADSAVCKIDGEKGELRYRGYLITELAEHSDFGETTMLLWNGELPTQGELDAFRTEFRSHRKIPAGVLEVLKLAAPKMGPMDMLRTTVSAMAMDDDGAPDDDAAANRLRGIKIAAVMPTLVATYHAMREGREPVAPRSDLSNAANFLYMMNGKEPSKDATRMFDVCLVLHAEHGFNASTFSGRVTAATLSDIYSSVTSAIGTLKGPLHGGANTAVMNMLEKIGSVDNVEPALDSMLANKEKIMGFGHRVYKVVDPRALILKEFARRMASEAGDSKWFDMSEKLEAAMKAKKGIDMNVDFYSASLYHYMGIPKDLFTCIFAMSRISGWMAHILEQLSNNRLIRPRSTWVGPDPRDYVPMTQRG